MKLDINKIKIFLSSQTKEELILTCKKVGAKNLSQKTKSEIVNYLILNYSEEIYTKFLRTWWDKYHNHVYGIATFIALIFTFYNPFSSQNQFKIDAFKPFDNYGLYDKESYQNITGYKLVCYCDDEYPDEERGYLGTENIKVTELIELNPYPNFFIYSPSIPADGQYIIFDSLSVNKYSKTLLAFGEPIHTSYKKVSDELFIVEPNEPLGEGTYSFYNVKDEFGYLFNIDL